MFDSLFRAICKVGIFMICAQTVIHFRPQEAYEKYMKLLVSVMILIQLFLPIGSFLLGDGMEKAAERLTAIREELEQELERTAREAADADKILENMTLEEIRKRQEELNSDRGGQTGEGRIEEGKIEEGQVGEGRSEEGKTGEGQGGEEQIEEGQGREVRTEEGKTEEGQTGDEWFGKQEEPVSQRSISEISVGEVIVEGISVGETSVGDLSVIIE